VLTFQ
jgi:hypothetical protein